MSSVFENPAESVVQQSTDGVMVLDPDWTCLYANEAAGRLWGRQANELIGGNLWQNSPTLVGTMFYDACCKVSAERIPIHVEAQHGPKNYWFEAHIYPQGDGRITAFFRNVTRRHLADMALQASEERYRLLFDKSPIPMVEEDMSGFREKLLGLKKAGVTDIPGYLAAHPDFLRESFAQIRVVAANPAAFELYHIDNLDGLIAHFTSLIEQNSQRESLLAFDYIAEGRLRFTYDVVNFTMTGKRLELELHWSVMPGSEESYRRVLVALVDVTGRKEQAAALRHQAVVLEQINEAVIVLDENSLIRIWNRTAERIYGWTASEAIGQRLASFLATQYESSDREEAMTLLTAHGHWEGEVTQRRKDGTFVPIHASVSLIHNEQGAMIGMVGVNRDISSLRQNEIAIRAAEQRYRHLFDEAPVMYLTLSAKDAIPIVLNVNRAYLQATGYTREEVIGHSNIEFLAPGFRQPAQEAYAQLVKGKVLEGEQRLIARDGKRIDTLLRAVPEYDAQGNVIGALAMYTDLTQRKAAERQQAREAERMQTLLHIASRLNRQLDLAGVMRAVCEEVSVVLGVPGVTLSLVDRQRNCFVHGADIGLAPNYNQLTQPVPVPDHLKGDLSKVDLIRLNPIDRLIDSPNYAMYLAQGLEMAVNVLLVRDNQLLGSLNLHITDAERGFDANDFALLRGVADIVTQAMLNGQLWDESRQQASQLEDLVKERTADLEVALYEAQAADRIKSQFVSDINHELRTPLTNIMLYLDLLTQGKPEKRDQAISIMRRETLRLRQLIEEVLDLSRLDLGKIEMYFQPIYLNHLIQGLLDDRAALLERSPLQIVFRAEQNLSAIAGDEALLTRVITNLLDNSLNYTQQGSIEIASGLTGAEEREWQTVTIRDTGPGIDPEDQPHIFERFYRGQAARQSGAPGTGLGLAISQEIADRHGGRITVESHYGRGSAFTLWLPIGDA
ncbi:MAG: PAS domain S-box protein [Caldilineaceae bacterium]|nr:PAS domain S-box protein [Caldilineaceae bacterium]